VVLLVGMTVIKISQLMRYLKEGPGNRNKAGLFKQFTMKEGRLCHE
jgi:hypothetical protein